MTRGQQQGWVVVTGATGGLGRALVSRLIAEGRDVIAAAREPGAIAAPDGPGRLQRVALDLVDGASIEAAGRAIAALVGDRGLAGLVNMAGLIVEGPVEAIAPASWRHQFEVNVIGPAALTQALLPLLRRGPGRVVNIGAISAHLTLPFYGPIAASKSALASLSHAMRQEFAPFGIRVVLVEPGAMRTGIFATSRAARDAALAARPDLDRRYRPALAAFDRAFAGAGADDPAVVTRAVMAALFAGRPRRRAVVGKGTGALVVLSRLPIGWRDRVVRAALGLSGLLKPAC